MQTVFSHIIQKRYSQQHEDVATDALAFILQSSEPARKGFMKLLRGIAPDIPPLEFQTQQQEDNMRPDMWGLDETGPRVFVENKFWAPLTDNQPVSYLQKLASVEQPAILLVIGPEANEQSLWRELCRRLEDHEVVVTDESPPAGVVRVVKTTIGPFFAITSWPKVIDTLKREVADNPDTQSDLHQLDSLCRAADSNAFRPFSGENLTDQRIPSLVLQLLDINWQATQVAITEGILNGSRAATRRERIGHYTEFPDNAGFFVGVHFELWKQYGLTPLWIVFHPTSWSRAPEVKSLVEPWASKQGIFTTQRENGEFTLALDLETGEGRDQVIWGIVERFREIADVLSVMSPREEANGEQVEEEIIEE